MHDKSITIYSSDKKLEEFCSSISLWRESSYNIKSISHGIILPYRNNSLKPQGYGGVLTESGEFVEASADSSFGGVYPFDKEAVSVINERVLFLGHSLAHWGVFLVDLTRRLYYLIRDRDLKIAFCGIGFTEGTFGPIHDKAMAFFAALGIEESEIIDVRNPTQFKEVVIPQMGYVRGDHIIPEFAFPFRIIRDQILANGNNDDEKFPEKIYLSRRKFRPKKESGECAIEHFFKQNGFISIYPEKLCFEEQVKLFANAKIIASIEGTIAHNILFCDSNVEQIIIRKQSEINPRQPLFNLAVGNKVTFVDCFIEPFERFPISHDDGPFLLVLNQNITAFAQDNGMKMSRMSKLQNLCALFGYFLLCVRISLKIWIYRLAHSTSLGKKLLMRCAARH